MAIPTIFNPMGRNFSDPAEIILKLNMTEATEYALNVSQQSGYDYSVDWGDGSALETFTTSLSAHTYTATGEYTVKYYPNVATNHFNLLHTNSSSRASAAAKFLTHLVKFAHPELITMANRMFRAYGNGCKNLVSLPDNFTLPNCTNTSEMFANCSSLTALPSGFNTPLTTNTSLMFSGCSSLTSLPSGFFDPLWSQVAASTDIDTRRMFGGCSRLTGVPASKFWEWGGTNDVHLIYNKSVFNGAPALIAEGNVPSTWYGNTWDSATNYQPEKAS